MSPRKKADGAGAARARKPRTQPGDAAATASATPPIAASAASARRLMRTPIEVRWRDLDAFSHVNNASFLTYVEEARLQWFQSLPGPWLTDHIAPVLAASHVNYRRPIEWPQHLAIELYAERVGNTSLTLAHRIVAAEDDRVLYSDGYSVLVWIDRHDGKAAPLPEAVRTACSAD